MKRLLVIVVSLAIAAPSRACDVDRDALLAEWREDFELDELASIVAEGPRLVSGDGPLARDGEAIALVGRALFAGGREGAAKSLLEAPVELDEVGRAHVELARASVALAEDDLSGVLALVLSSDGTSVRRPDYADAWLLAGQALARGGAPERADAFLLRFVQLAPPSADLAAAYHMLAQHAVARRDVERAREYRERGERAARWQALLRARRIQIRAQPDDPLPRLGLAQLWFEAGDPGRAKDALVELIERAPREARAWTLLGDCERHLGNMAAARAGWDRAVEIDTAQIGARFNRGVLARMEVRLADARADFDWILEHGAEDELRYRQAHLELARLDLAAGLPDRAEARYAKYRGLGGTEPLR